MSAAPLVIVAPDEAATRAIGRQLADALRGGDVVVVDGPLGAGKTRLAKGVAAGLGLDPADVSSPTYVICHEHPGARDGLTLAHVDAYRIRGSAEDLESVGWDDFAGDPEVVTIVEWGERVAEALPPTAVHIRIDLESESVRRLEISGRGAAVERAREQLAGWADGD